MGAIKRALFYDLIALGADAARRKSELVRRAFVRCFHSHLPGERNRGALSVDPVPDPSSAYLRTRAQQKLRSSVSLADIEQAAPRSKNHEPSDGRLPELAVLAPWRAAAVVLPIIDRPGGLTVLLTLRASGLRAHSGQVAFPGGKIDAGETPHEAALREVRRKKLGWRSGSSSRWAGSIPFLPEPDFASRPWSRWLSRRSY